MHHARVQPVHDDGLKLTSKMFVQAFQQPYLGVASVVIDDASHLCVGDDVLLPTAFICCPQQISEWGMLSGHGQGFS